MGCMIKVALIMPRLGPTSDLTCLRERKSTLVLSDHTIILSWTEELLFPSPLYTLCVDPSGHPCLILCRLTIQAMPIAELFLGAFFQVLLDKLASRILLNFERHEVIEMRLKNWEKELIDIKQALGDAEDKLLEDEIRGKQEKDESRVKSWLINVTNLAYDIEDLLAEFAIESAQNESESEPGTSKVHSLLPSCGFRLSARKFMVNHEMRSKMEEMDARLKEITAEKDRLSLKKNSGMRPANSQEKNPRATSNLPEPCFVSRDVEKREILQLLTREEDDRTCANLKVIPILGMGGIGKTALAQQVYNDAGVINYFDIKVWACVSDSFDMPAVTKSILEQINNQLTYQDRDLNWLQEALKKHLDGKKFLVVLDDVWNDIPGNWNDLLKPFRSGAKGSKIILTTRNLRIAEIAHAPPYKLEQLSLDACVTLFTFHALRETNFDCHPELKDLGMKLVEKCGGLPLAVKTLAGLLSSKDSRDEWEDVLESKIWDLQPQGPNDVSPALKLSYLHLPSNLRRCFAYCAIFPNDHVIERDELIHWWIDEGFLDGTEAKSRWNASLKFFNELVARSLLQKSSSSESQFLMHDLVNDLAKLVAGAIYFSSVTPESPGDQNDAFLARHASFIPSSYITPQKLKIYHGMKGLRSFISLAKDGKFDLSEKVLCDLLSRLRYLRVLSLTSYSITEVPDCIGKLRHLRLLNLSYTNIEMLPKSIIMLYNLEALMLRGCQNLTELPKYIEKLINLRFLDITDTWSLRAMPLHIGSLVGLEMLTKFVVGTENGSRLKELKNLKNLGGELCISDLHKVQEAEDATNANLCTKEGICRLTMEWCNDFENFRDEELEEEVLGYLHPHQNLENLVISYYGGLEFPSWLGNPSYINMVHLRLHGCCRAKTIPPLGQLSNLKELSIEGLNALCKIGSEFYGTKSPFPSLITLELSNMLVWEDWSHCPGDEGGVVFPRLERLLIQDCPMLMARLPSQLSSLVKLEIKSCPRMNASPSIISLPSLKELDFGGCNEGMLKSLVNLTSLIALAIRDVVELTCLNHEFIGSLIKLEKLEMEKCNKLLYLWQDGGVIRNLPCLKELIVQNCPELISFVAGEGDMELPGNLETMHLSDCINLEKLPSKMHALSSLRVLTVKNCPRLVSFPETGIPRSMTSMRIEDCEMLQSLPIGISTHPNESSSRSSSHGDSNTSSCLKELIIRSCGSLGASPFNEDRFLPVTLKRLEIRWCNGVESLAEINADRLHSLQEIEIWDCDNLRSLPEGLHTLTNLTFLRLESLALELECLPLPPSIKIIWLHNCSNIKSLPNQLNRLTCLRDLNIRNCKSITRFPDGGLPPQLQRLSVWDCENMKQPVREWLTPRLTSLELLWIDGSVGGVGEGVDLVLPLPPSLLHLSIVYMGKVERMASSLPPSLRSLYFWNCPKLRELPRDGLPPSLECFAILAGCGVLEERCRKGTGLYWPLLREIGELKLSGVPGSPSPSPPLCVASSASSLFSLRSVSSSQASSPSRLPPKRS